MAADSKGRDSSKALVYVTGSAAFATVASANVVEKAELGSATLTAPEAFKYLGLRTSDGGPEESTDAGEAIEFLEAGFEISGEGEITVAMTLAQYNSTVREHLRGVAADENGVIEVKSVTPDTMFILLLESVYKNGAVKRQHGVARISEVAPGKDERGSLNGQQVTYKWMPHELFNNSYYWEAFVEDAAEAPEDLEA